MKQLKPTINKQLSQAGLATLDDPRSLLAQIALGIKSHEQFRKLLEKVAPEDRSNCYNSLASRLCFSPKPLDTYIAEARNQADADKLPTFDADTGKITEYGAVGPININALAERAIAQAAKEAEAKGRLELVCSGCTLQEFFFAKRRTDAWRDAVLKGWRRNAIAGTQHCPKCAAERATEDDSASFGPATTFNDLP